MALQIPHKKLNSSMIKSVGYTQQYGGILEVLFHDGSLWRYKNVPPVIYDQLQQVESPGSYFHHMVKTRFIGGPVAKRSKDVI